MDELHFDFNAVFIWEEKGLQREKKTFIFFMLMEVLFE